jgi:hypothetical protein
VSLAELEASRKRTLLTSGILFSLAGVLFFLGLGVLGAFLALFARFLIKYFQAKAEVALVAPLAEAVGFRYSPKRGFSKEEALASGLFPSPDGYEAEDLVEGEVRDIPFVSSDITLDREVVRFSNGSVSKKFFRGTLYRFHLPFSVEGEVRFGPRSVGRGVVDRQSLLIGALVIGSGLLISTVLVVSGRFSAWTVYIIFLLLAPFVPGFLASIPRRKKKLGQVVLESPEFEHFYDAYGDQVEVRKLLTPRVQEALVRLRKYFGRPVWGAMRGRDLWLAIGGRDRFPVPILRPVSEVFDVGKARYQEELLEVSRVVEALRLEEEAKRKGVRQEKALVGQGESSSVSKKESATLDDDEPQ